MQPYESSCRLCNQTHRMKNAAIAFLLCAISAVTSAQSVENGRQLFEQKKYPEARKQLLNVKEGQKDFAAAQYYLGRIAFLEKNFEDALEYFEEATEANENIADYQEWLGNAAGSVARSANVFRQGMLAPKMKAAWEKAVALDPKRISPRFSLIEYYLEAPGMMGGSKEKAEATAKEIIALSPADGYRALGNVYNRTERIAEAEKAYTDAARLNEDYVPVLANFYMTHNQHDKSFSLFEKALQRNPDDMMAHYQYGRTAAISGKNLEAGEKSLRKYLTYQPAENEPSHAGANMRLAQIYEKRANKPEAKKLYELALSKDPSLKEAKEGLARLSK